MVRGRDASPRELAERMAGKADLIKDVLGRTPADDENLQSELAAQFHAFRENPIHDITAEDFADIYAETVAYGMFAARLHDRTRDTFSRARSPRTPAEVEPLPAQPLHLRRGLRPGPRLPGLRRGRADGRFWRDHRAKRPLSAFLQDLPRRRSSSNRQGMPEPENRARHGLQADDVSSATWRKPDGACRMPEIIEGVECKDGIKRLNQAARPARRRLSGIDRGICRQDTAAGRKRVWPACGGARQRFAHQVRAKQRIVDPIVDGKRLKPAHQVEMPRTALRGVEKTLRRHNDPRPVGERGEQGKLPARRDVPQPHRIVKRSAGDRPPVRAECNAQDIKPVAQLQNGAPCR